MSIPSVIMPYVANIICASALTCASEALATGRVTETSCIRGEPSLLTTWCPVSASTAGTSLLPTTLEAVNCPISAAGTPARTAIAISTCKCDTLLETISATRPWS